MLVVPFRGQNQLSGIFNGVSNFRPSWYLLGCFSHNKIPEISISTRTILMISLEPLEHIDEGVLIFGIFRFFCF